MPERPDPSVITLVTSPLPVVIPAHGVVVAESRHAEHFSADLCDAHAKFHLCLAGRAQWQGGGSDCQLSAGMLVFVAAGVAHRQRDLPGEPVSLVFIHLRPELLPAATHAPLAQAGLIALDLLRQPSDLHQRVRALFQEMSFEQDAARPGWEAVLCARALDLAALTLRLSARGSAAVVPAPATTTASADSSARVAAYARAQESQFYRQESLAEAASAVHLGRRRFTELFRAVTGETWIQRLLRLRLQHAERLLRDSERSITAIAFDCGFEDISHFNHSFKRAYACTPSAFRGRHRPIAQA